jgi:LysR family transcriptional regulator, regulator of abg operon
MIKFHQLRDFVAIAEAGSVRAAARSLGQAQPAMSRSLSELEQVLGVSLVERHARGVVLTTAGERFRVRARSMLAELQRGIEEASHRPGNAKAIAGAVSVVLSSAPMLAQLPAAFRAMSELYPRVRLSIGEAAFPAAEPLLRSGRIDFFVGPRPGPPVVREYRIELLYRNQRQVFARMGHPLRGARRLSELQNAQWLCNGLLPRAEQDLEELFARHKLAAPRALTRVDSLLGTLTLLTGSDAVAALPCQWIDAPMLAGLICALPLQDAIAAPDIVLIHKSGLPLTPAADLFAQLLRRQP